MTSKGSVIVKIKVTDKSRKTETAKNKVAVEVRVTELSFKRESFRINKSFPSVKLSFLRAFAMYF